MRGLRDSIDRVVSRRGTTAIEVIANTHRVIGTASAEVEGQLSLLIDERLFRAYSVNALEMVYDSMGTGLGEVMRQAEGLGRGRYALDTAVVELGKLIASRKADLIRKISGHITDSVVQLAELSMALIRSSVEFELSETVLDITNIEVGEVTGPDAARRAEIQSAFLDLETLLSRSLSGSLDV